MPPGGRATAGGTAAPAGDMACGPCAPVGASRAGGASGGGASGGGAGDGHRDAYADSGNYRDTAVRDLAWLLQSVPLLDRECFGDQLADLLPTETDRARAAAWLAALDADPVALHDALRERPQTRLGLYAEQLLAFFFAHGPGPRLVAANRAVRVDGHTLGECDFLLEGHDGRALHWELAVKCYLHVGGDTTSLAQYVGPNLADRFDLKLDRMLTHQLALSAHPQIVALAPGSGRAWHPAMLVCGWLFYRWTSSAGQAASAPAEPPHESAAAERSAQAHGSPVGPGAPADTRAVPRLAPGHARGWWVSAAQWPPFDAPAWAIVPRLRWMAPLRFARADDPAVLRDPMAVLARCTEYWRLRPDQPLMAAALAPDDETRACDGGLHEFSRGFIVPDDWPAHARAYAAASPRGQR